MQVFGIKVKPTKYSCRDCGKKLYARLKTPKWREIPTDQKDAAAVQQDTEA